MCAYRSRVAYFYDHDVGNYYYALGHPMKPHRMRMVHELLIAYGVHEKLQVMQPPRATERDLTRFHSDDYIEFLKRITPETAQKQMDQLQRFGLFEDSPCFDDIYRFCQISAGGSLAGAARLNRGFCDVAINWSGGLHHAKKSEASGFCYVNDCVLAILELLKHHARVLYCDVDVHHGDGVEEAFYTTDRVMTCSFHKFGNFFPGTGDVRDIGHGPGRHYALNFPLQDGIDDECYREIFVPIMSRVMDWYQPTAVVLQCGADSLSGDRLGCFNLSLDGHAQCVRFFQKYGVQLMLLGGGGYTIRNVARCWTYETAIAAGVPLDDAIPYNPYFEYYGPDFRLHTRPSNMENLNTPSYLHRIMVQLLESLRSLPHTPSVPYHHVPEDIVSDPLLRKFMEPIRGDDDDDEVGGGGGGGGGGSPESSDWDD